MASNIFQQGKLFSVFYTKGVFDDDRGAQKAVKAPFNFLKLQGANYLVPDNVNMEAKGGAINQYLMNSSTVDEDLLIFGQNQLFFHALGPIVVGEHQMGAGTDDWMGVNAFSFI